MTSAGSVLDRTVMREPVVAENTLSEVVTGLVGGGVRERKWV